MTGWTNAIYGAAKGLRDHADGAGGELAALLRSDAPMDADTREMLALLVTDRLLPDRNTRPPGEKHPWHVQAAAAVDYRARVAAAPRGHAARIKHAIGKPLEVGESTIGAWITDYSRTVTALDAQMHAAAARVVDARIKRLEWQGRPERAALIQSHRDQFIAKQVQFLTRLGRDGASLMRQMIAINSK